MADEIVLMRDGRIVQTGAPYNLYHAPADAEAAAFFSDVNVIRGRSNGALTDTPFGAFLTPGHPHGAEVEIVFRPQHVAIDFDRQGPVPTPRRRRARPRGAWCGAPASWAPKAWWSS